ncbi:hypothetical protein FMEAI12_730001 [Parafrankia sp. Ea1.12]|nr:hypothetical protein FMEAI12_730001 [Parafrankia sp. Ea1.12]
MAASGVVGEPVPRDPASAGLPGSVVIRTYLDSSSLRGRPARLPVGSTGSRGDRPENQVPRPGRRCPGRGRTCWSARQPVLSVRRSWR